MEVPGTVGEFSDIGEEWPMYIEQMEVYFTTNKVESAENNSSSLLRETNVYGYEAWWLQRGQLLSRTKT